MSREEEAIARVAEILKRSKKYPWKTARYLSRRLSSKDVKISAEDLENALLDHAKQPDRKLRYSFFPARKSLDLLWGHIDVVKEAHRLPDPHLTSEFGEFQPCDVPENRVWCFLSHNFGDLPQVRKIYYELLHRGYGVWLAEAEVLKGKMIHKTVQQALRVCDRFVLYASKNALGSRWVLKEALQAIHREDMAVTVIIDGHNDPLNRLFVDWIEGRWDDSLEARVNELVKDIPQDPAATMLSDLLRDGLGTLPVEDRVVVLSPFSETTPDRRFRTFDDEFSESQSIRSN